MHGCYSSRAKFGIWGISMYAHNLSLSLTHTHTHTHTHTAATVHSPSNVALNDMLRAQLMLTRQLIASSRQTLENVSANLSSDHHYTTLEDTKDVSKFANLS